MIPPRGRRTARVFVDSSAFFALGDRDDRNHRTAVTIQDQLITRRIPQLTTNFIVAETHALFLARLGRRAAGQFLDRLEASNLELIRVRAADEARARSILKQYDDKDFSYTDATSFAVVERLGIGQVFTFDRDFTRYGIPSVTAPGR